MKTGTIWQQIHQTLSLEISTGHYPKGEKLPTEAALAKRFSVNRHTIRRALASLQEEGLIHVRQGAGAFVSQTLVDYSLGRKTRFSQNLAGTGLKLKREILRLETLPASEMDAELLRIAAGAPVHVLETLNIVDKAPFSYSSSLFPAADLPNLPESLRAHGSITAALAENGVHDYSRAWTKLTAKRAIGPVARALKIAEGAAVLRTVSLNIDSLGTPLEYGRTWFHGDRAQLVVSGEDGETSS